MSEVVERINLWLEGDFADDSDKTLRDARDEIVALRAKLAESREVLSGAIRSMGRYAHRAGYCEGTLMMIAAGHPDPAAVAAETLHYVERKDD